MSEREFLELQVAGTILWAGARKQTEPHMLDSLLPDCKHTVTCCLMFLLPGLSCCD